MSLLSHESRFSKAPVNNISRSIFDRSNTLVTSFSAGKLVPIFLDEVIPGDTCTMDVSALVRMATPLYPVMDTAWCDIHFFFVPARLVWKNWKYFMGEAQDAWDSEMTYEVPHGYCTPKSDSLSGYFGLPQQFSNGNPGWCLCNALPFRAYELIWNEWFRDQNLQDSVLVDMGDSSDTLRDELLPVNKLHDYFTSCLPEPQKGVPLIPILSGQIPVTAGFSHASGPISFGGGGVTDGWNSLGFVSEGGVGTLSLAADPNSASKRQVTQTNMVADFDDLVSGSIYSSNSINALRQAFAVQRLFERDARGGTRYRELIKAHFGVDNGDSRMQVPEYLGGSHIPINITQVVQQSSTASEPSPLGEVGAMSKTVYNGSLFTKSFTEHGFLMGFVSVRTDHSYLSGIPRMMLRRSRFDYYWPELANLGEQAVWAKEIYGAANDGDVFGYQEAWADYRYKPNLITGKMAFTGFADSQSETQLSPWHYGDYYAERPYLSEGWIKEPQSNVARTLAVSNTELFDQFIANFYFKARWARPMPVYSIPGLTGHI